MSTRGLLNIFSNGRQYDFNYKTLSHTMQSDFVTLYNFLNGTVGQSLGIVRRAFNQGSRSSLYDPGFQFTCPPGTGMNYFDRPGAAGNNAWAVFEFTQANPKFWVLLQFSAEQPIYNIATFGDSPGSPALNQSFKPVGGYPWYSGPAVAVAVAFRKDGTSPWTGTTNNNGSDSKGLSVWSSGSVCFPRPNQFGAGGHTAVPGDIGSYYFLDNGSGMMTIREGIVSVNVAPDIGYRNNTGDAVFDSYSGLMHIIAKEDTLLILTDNKGYGNYSIFYFGKYVPLKAVEEENLDWANYVCLQQHMVYDGYPIIHRFGDAYNSVYGTRWMFQNINSNGIVELVKMQGGVNHVLANECRGVIISNDNILGQSDASDTPSYLRHPNRAASDPTGRKSGVYDIINIPIALYEDHERFGHLGEIDFIKMARDIPTHATLNNKQYAVFGGTVKNAYKIVVPWDGVTNPGVNGSTREGILW